MKLFVNMKHFLAHMVLRTYVLHTSCSLYRAVGRYENPGGHVKVASSLKILEKLCTVLGGKFKISAQDSDLEYSCWRCKNSPVSSDLKPPLVLHSQSDTA